jgi:hypothetical protein
MELCNVAASIATNKNFNSKLQFSLAQAIILELCRTWSIHTTDTIRPQKKRVKKPDGLTHGPVASNHGPYPETGT